MAGQLLTYSELCLGIDLAGDAASQIPIMQTGKSATRSGRTRACVGAVWCVRTQSLTVTDSERSAAHRGQGVTQGPPRFTALRSDMPKTNSSRAYASDPCKAKARGEELTEAGSGGGGT